MKQFPSDIKFKYDWRKYQERVLDELEGHLDDNHLHIIAPPGSGKTVLGLEVALRLDKPTLVLAPTVAIRNQWIQRFCELFLQVKQKPDWISRDIKNPQFLTVATYQALHAACSGADLDEEQEESEEENGNNGNGKGNSKTKEIIQLLQAQNIGTIVVDEAHHLKNAWWQSLTEVKKALNPTIVGLTATPPYDVSHLEWQRYIELNGPVDAEISVPELVVEGDLCPHQDYVFFSRPTIEESQKIDEYRQRIKTLFNDIKADQPLIQALERHPIYQTPNEQLDWIYTNLEYYSATLIFLNAVGKEITKDHLEIIGDKKFTVPELNYEWIEILLTFYLYKDPDNFAQYEEHQKKLTNKLKRNGAIERRSVNFRHNRKINNFLSSSISKLRSIDQIVDFEHDHLKQDLRMVILTDYIRKEFLVSQSTNSLELNKIGVLPIFEQLRRTNERNIKIGVLTGSLIIVPVSAFEAFKEMAAKYKIERLSTSPLPFDNQYLVVNSTEQLKHDIVHIITQVFQKGHIEVLVGTKSLLGEGWDAPSINSLILASFVGSYVLSNQMRGRAIRTERQNIDKTGNIWHLVCADTTTPDGGDDIQLLKRRFKAFVGVSFREEVSIENGIGRLDLPDQLTIEQEIVNLNNRMLTNAGQRDQLKKKWKQALESGATLIEEIKVPFPEDKEYKSLKSLYYNRTIKYLLGMLGSGLVGFGFEALQGLGRAARHIRSKEDLIYWLMFIGGLGFVIFGRLAFKTFRAFVKYRDISKDIHQIGEALLESLIKVGAIHTDYSKLTVVSDVDDYGAIYCHLEGGTTYEKSTFIKSLQEIIGTVDNPRYVVIRKSFFLNVLSQKDYHSVPEIIGRKKQFAEYFERQWRRFVGACELVYTRTVEGRKLLLKSRIHSLASEFEDKTERINKWK
ncbi:DEAD/DEAH box helicase family protein [uncultured Marivirga sp.]|uniref:DEAD/DEAH box helicase family protein n=1 Tax=uncultured Marivirga sp. TaxID=1123707 RepID=UPI0030EC9584